MKLRSINFQILAIIFFLYNCSDNLNKVEPTTFELGDTLTIGYGKTLYNNSEDQSIKFDSVLTDSRCPINVICVWEGDAEVKFTISNDDNFIDFTLHTAKDYFSTDTTLFGYNIELIGLLPYPHTEIQHLITEYKAVIIIRGE